MVDRLGVSRVRLWGEVEKQRVIEGHLVLFLVRMRESEREIGEERVEEREQRAEDDLGDGKDGRIQLCRLTLY